MTFSGVSRSQGGEFPSKAFNRLRSMTSATGNESETSGEMEVKVGGAEIDTSSIRRKPGDGSLKFFEKKPKFNLPYSLLKATPDPPYTWTEFCLSHPLSKIKKYIVEPPPFL